MRDSWVNGKAVKYISVMSIHIGVFDGAYFRKQFGGINLNFNLTNALVGRWFDASMMRVSMEHFVCCFASFRFVLEIKFLFTLIWDVSSCDFARFRYLFVCLIESATKLGRATKIHMLVRCGVRMSHQPWINFHRQQQKKSNRWTWIQLQKVLTAMAEKKIQFI